MDRLALITGATSGIGWEYSQLLAKKGWNIIITGRREELLNRNAKYLRDTYGVVVEAVIVDFNSDTSYRYFINNFVKMRNIGFLVNNVGFSNHRDFFNSEFSDNHKIVEAFISRMSEITHIVVDNMRENRQGIIVNVSSLAGYLPSLSDPFYSSSKAFINIYSESIGLILSRYNIIVQSLCPGFTKTDFHKKMNLSSRVFKNRGLKRWMEAKDVVMYSYRNLRIGKVIVIPGFCNKIVYHVSRSIPKRLYYHLAGRKRVLNEK